MSKNREIGDMIRQNLAKGKTEFEEFGDLTTEQVEWCFRMLDRTLTIMTSQQDYIDDLYNSLTYFDHEVAETVRKDHEDNHKEKE